MLMYVYKQVHMYEMANGSISSLEIFPGFNTSLVTEVMFIGQSVCYETARSYIDQRIDLFTFGRLTYIINHGTNLEL